MSEKKHEWTRKGVTASMAVVLAFGMVPMAPSMAFADNDEVTADGTAGGVLQTVDGSEGSSAATGSTEEKAPSITGSNRFAGSLVAPDSSSTIINNAFFANGDDVTVEPYGDGTLKVTVGNDVYSFDTNDMNGGLTIFAGYNNNLSASEEGVKSNRVTIKQGANVAAVYGGGYANSRTGTVEIEVEEGACARAIYGGGATPYGNAGVSTGVQVNSVDISVKGYAYLVYAGGNSAVGKNIDEVIKRGNSNELVSATNLVQVSNTVVDGQCDNYLGGSFSYGAVNNSTCTVNGTLGSGKSSDYSAVAGANGYVGSATMTVSEKAQVKGALYMSMRGYVGDVSLTNKGAVDSVSLNPDGTDVSSFGNVRVDNSGSIGSCYLDCGCSKKSIDSNISSWPSLVRVSGNVTVSTDHWEANKESRYEGAEGQVVALLDGAKLAEGQSISNLAIASSGEKYYVSLAEAIEDVSAGGTVTLLSDCTGGGIGTYINPGEDVNGNQQIGVKNFTLDLGGHEYKVNSPAVGSKGYETQGFHLEKGAAVTIKNGTISSTGSEVKMLVQNYCDLTLADVTLDGTSLPGNAYVLSNNHGNTKLTGNTNILANGGSYAFDLYYWPSNGYGDGLTVTLDEHMTGTIAGNVEYASDGTMTDVAEKAKLFIQGGTMLGNIVTSENETGISISGGVFAICPEEEYVAESSIVKKNTTEEGLVSFQVVSANSLGEGVYMSDPTQYLASGCYATDNGDGTWTVYRQSTGGSGSTGGGSGAAPSEPEGEVVETPTGPPPRP